jgi:hypothetical protein
VKHERHAGRGRRLANAEKTLWCVWPPTADKRHSGRVEARHCLCESVGAGARHRCEQKCAACCNQEQQAEKGAKAAAGRCLDMMGGNGGNATLLLTTHESASGGG